MDNHQIQNENYQMQEEPLNEIPANKTLFISQFTGQIPIRPEENPILTSTREVFDFFQPYIISRIETEKRESTDAKFLFNSLEDFSPEYIINNNFHLKLIRQLCIELSAMREKVAGNKFFDHIVQNPSTKKSFSEVINTIIYTLDSYD